MEKENNKNKKIYILIALSLCTFVIMTIGTTFSFFTSTIRGNEDAGEVKLETADLLLVYNSKKDIVKEDALPGWEDEMIFEIRNTTDGENIAGSYSINWEIEKNEIKNNDLVYTIECVATKDGKEVPESKYNKVVNITNELNMPTTSSKIGDGIINSGDIQTCTVKVKFKDTNSDQNDNQGKSFSGKIVVLGNKLNYEGE